MEKKTVVYSHRINDWFMFVLGLPIILVIALAVMFAIKSVGTDAAAAQPRYVIEEIDGCG